MRGMRSGGSSRRGPRFLILLTERELRRRWALARDDHLTEWKQGKIEWWRVDGYEQPVPLALKMVDIGPLAGLASCSYSSRRLFFGSTGVLAADLEKVWRVESTANQLSVAFSAPSLTEVCWRSDEREDAAALAGFAGRILAQRERRLASLSPEARQQAADSISDLQASGALSAALAQPRPGPRTQVGLWLRACLTHQPELRQALVPGLNGGKAGWNDDEPAVVQAAAGLLLRRYLGSACDQQAVTAFVSQITAALTPRPEIDPAKIETMIRVALGDSQVTANGITPGQQLGNCLLAATMACNKLALTNDAIDQVITDSERIACEQGWNPPPAQSEA
jgi:hypothetical protein